MSFDLIPTPYGTVIFCDDIREEIGGKTTLVGCYSAELVVNPGLPADMPKFGMACRLVFDKFEGNKSFDIIVVMPDETIETAKFITHLNLNSDTLAATGVVPSDPQHPRILILCHIIGGPFRIACEGIIQVLLREEGRTIRIGVLKIRVG